MFKLERCRGYSWVPGALGKGRPRQSQQQNIAVVLPLRWVPCTCVGQKHSDRYVGAEAHIHPDAILRGTRGKERSNLIQKRLTTMSLIRKFKPCYPPLRWVQVQDSIGWRRDFITQLSVEIWNLCYKYFKWQLFPPHFWMFLIALLILESSSSVLTSSHFLPPGNSWLGSPPIPFSSLSESESSSANSIYLLGWDPLDMYVFGFSEVPVTYVHRFMWDFWVPSKSIWSRKHKRGSHTLALIPEVEEHMRIQLWKF